MPSQRPSSENSEEGRAFLQSRVALFWKVIFFNKDPDRRPQSAAELRRRVEACPVEPWDSARALAWWREYQPYLDDGAAQSTGESMTIAVDGAHRSSMELAGSRQP